MAAMQSRRQSRMQGRGVSYIGILVGIALGIGGSLFYTWQLNPQVVTNIEPWQLSTEYQQQYLITVSLEYAQDHDLMRTVQHLAALNLGDKAWQTLADTACDLSRKGYMSTNANVIAVRSMVDLAQSQGATGCASVLLPAASNTPAPTPTVVTATPSLIPPSTKTPTATLGPTFTPADLITPEIEPTPAGNFELVQITPYCTTKTPGLIEVSVQDADGSGIPGITVEVSTLLAKEQFFTGLKSEKDPGYADYQMEKGNSYVISVPGVSERSNTLEAKECPVPKADGGGKSITSYRAVFRRAANR
jgi:hypothetical protein